MGWGGFSLAWGEDYLIPAAYQTATAPVIQSLFNDPYASYDFVLEGSVWKHNVTIEWPDAWGSLGPWGKHDATDLDDILIRYGWRGLVTGREGYEPIKNLITDNDDLDTWTDVGTPTFITGDSDPLGGSTAMRVVDNDSTIEGIYSTLSYDADGTKSFAIALRQGTSSDCAIRVYDATDAANLISIKITWSAGAPTPTIQEGAGTFHTAEVMASGWYLIQFTAQNVVAANTNRFYIEPARLAADTGTLYVWRANAYERTDDATNTTSLPLDSWTRSLLLTTGSVATGDGNWLREDIPANRYFPAALTVPVNFELSIPPSGLPATASGGFGAVEFVPVNDDDLGYWAGRSFNIKLGGTYNQGLSTETKLTFSQYVTRWRVIADDIEYDQETVRLYVRDALNALNVPVQTSTYAGTGTYEGGDAIKGAYKPLVYGSPFNVPCVLIDDTNYMYQVNDGAVNGITDVRIDGDSQSDQGDTTDLPGWTGGSAGEYKTDISRGLFRLWSQPGGEVTADADRATTAGGLVLLEMLNDVGIYNVDVGTFYGNMPDDIGLYVGTGEENALDLCNRIAQNSDCYLFANRVGQITLGSHPNVMNDPAHFEIEGRLSQLAATSAIANLRRMPTPPAPKTISVAYKRNWRPQDEDGLDTGLTAAQKQSYSRDHLATDTAANGGAVTINPSAPDIFYDGGYLKNEADAETLRDAIIARLGSKRDLFQVEITAPLFQITPGQVVKIYHDRFQLSDGRCGEVLRLVEGPITTTLDVLMVST